MTQPGLSRSDFTRALSRGIDALAQGKSAEAAEFALAAVRMDPAAEEAWLLLAAAAPPQNRARYLKHLLKLHPQSDSARQALAELKPPLARSSAVGAPNLPSPEEILAQIPPAPGSGSAPADGPQAPDKSGGPSDGKPSKAPNGKPSAGTSGKDSIGGRGIRWTAVLVSISCLLAFSVTAFAGAAAYAQEAPVVARVVREQSPIPPSFTPSFTPSITPSFTPTYTPTFTPTPTYTATNTLPPTNTPIPDAYIIPGAGGERWIDVDISSQSLTAYEGSTPIRTFIVSTGTAAHPTLLGRYRIYAKLRYDAMSGPGYYLPNVPYTMYYYQGYAIHGTYWHNNFGTPMSHGCINMRTPDAEYMFYFSSIGTLVNIHW
ncbi:MAG: L,D-transpeptidase family protein [Anaerolineales bacterium]|nr:L,D-transpeptidase family protein [Anaerolineales bacterium]